MNTKQIVIYCLMCFIYEKNFELKLLLRLMFTPLQYSEYSSERQKTLKMEAILHIHNDFKLSKNDRIYGGHLLKKFFKQTIVKLA